MLVCDICLVLSCLRVIVLVPGLGAVVVHCCCVRSAENLVATIAIAEFCAKFCLVDNSDQI